MKTVDILLPTQRHAHTINKAIQEFASQADAKQWTEAAVAWGKLVEAAKAIQELEHPMRQILFQESQ